MMRVELRRSSGVYLYFLRRVAADGVEILYVLSQMAVSKTPGLLGTNIVPFGTSACAHRGKYLPSDCVKFL